MNAWIRLLGNDCQRQKRSALHGIFGKQRTIAGMNPRHYRGFILRKLLVVGKIELSLPKDVACARRQPAEDDKARHQTAIPTVSASTSSHVHLERSTAAAIIKGAGKNEQAYRPVNSTLVNLNELSPR